MQTLGLQPAPTEQGPWGWGPPVLQLSGMFLLKDCPSPPRLPRQAPAAGGGAWEGCVLSAATPAGVFMEEAVEEALTCLPARVMSSDGSHSVVCFCHFTLSDLCFCFSLLQIKTIS